MPKAWCGIFDIFTLILLFFLFAVRIRNTFKNLSDSSILFQQGDTFLQLTTKTTSEGLIKSMKKVRITLFLKICKLLLLQMLFWNMFSFWVIKNWYKYALRSWSISWCACKKLYANNYMISLAKCREKW